LRGSCFRLVPPEQAEALAMPTKQAVGFDDHQRLTPCAETARDQDEEGAVAPSEGRTLGLTLKPNQWLAQKGVFGD